ncbi:porin [Aquimarina sp. U1-2]|uniref:porin n=1 Tax=Aquimarina sp. U1-2 TaxID=2823141 RepID=UPI001AECE437|nr:porin [Aquimarina sp. U1-2]MBP2831014.1 porin [Aquimarina sp. U1-2]
MKKMRWCFTLIIFLICTVVSAQGSDNYEGGLRIQLNEDGSKYVRLIMLHQFRVRSLENNPGTVDSSGNPDDESFDIALRRSRFFLYSQLSDKFLIFTQFGINNQAFNDSDRKPQLFIHDAWTEYAVLPQQEDKDFSLYLGAGLHYWNGISRMSNTSVLNFLAMDLPLFNFPNFEQTDQFARQFGIYAKGKLGKFDYRFHLNKPFIEDQRDNATETRAFTVPSDKVSLGGYIDYAFFEKEANTLPYKTGTYLGTKKVFNLGAGFYHHADASGILNSDGTIERENQTVFAVDAFYDSPIGQKDMALTTYAGFYTYDYGTNFYRSAGFINTGIAPEGGFDGTPSIDGFGNAAPLLGTGQIYYLQSGLLLPSFSEKDKVRWQPYGTISVKDLDFLDETVVHWDAGINCLINAHHAKLTLNYASRPLMVNTNGRNVQDGRRWEINLQAQIYL